MRTDDDPLAALLAVMARLRDPERGCPWDREQTFATIAPCTLEEAYEVADAIDRGDAEALRGELGDLLFQVVFHARMAQERGWFDFAAVARGIHDKLVRRHPHVFGDARVDSAAEQTARWEDLKARERAAAARGRGGDASTLADVPKALPALVRAQKLGRRAAAVGFDWPDARAVRDKVTEELAELDAAPAEHVAEELGDLLFSIANWSRHLRIDPEEALRAANAKFERRFRQMEALAAARGIGSLSALTAGEWDALWREVKGDG
ncbi:MAG TPA: nucleoside triphosphate pyrophosphohydrolase [Steroidobacteraceae bacterium]|nr:nucleoside triphosphate pyrophosphohydrolase [Steroidobacteraceae bacterium]